MIECKAIWNIIMNNVYFFICDANTPDLTNECIRRIIKNVSCISKYKIIVCRNDIYGQTNYFKLDSDLKQNDNIILIHPIYDKFAYDFTISQEQYLKVPLNEQYKDKKFVEQNIYPLIVDGDVRHAISIQYAIDHYDGDIIFVDSDCFIQSDIQCLFSNKICSYVHVNNNQNENVRIQPYLMRINSNMAKQKNIKWISYDTLEKYKITSLSPIFFFMIPNWINDNRILRCHLHNGAIFRNELITNNLQFDIIQNNNICKHLNGASYLKYQSDTIREFIERS